MGLKVRLCDTYKQGMQKKRVGVQDLTGTLSDATNAAPFIKSVQRSDGDDLKAGDGPF
jgi:hypothetical protein